jgi:hypothetical protein
VGPIISFKVMPIPLAMDAAVPRISSILLAIGLLPV